MTTGFSNVKVINVLNRSCFPGCSNDSLAEMHFLNGWREIEEIKYKQFF